MDIAERFRRNIEAISENGYFVDPTERMGMPYFNLALFGLGYVMRTNTLIQGEPGFGKTTGARTVMAAFSGLPYDLYHSLQIEGMPDQSRETLIGRPDYHKLQTEGEVTIWNLGVYLPAVLVDEMNRIPEGKQAALLNCIDTGRFNSPLGHTIHSGKLPFYATANYEDNGSHLLTPPLQDRIDLGTELGYLGPFHQDMIDRAREKRQEISDPERVTQMMEGLNDRKLRDSERFDLVRKHQEQFSPGLRKHGLRPFSRDELGEMMHEIESIEFAQDALILYDCIASEMNFTPLYSLKRRGDIVDDSTHGKSLASSMVKNSFSPRGALALKRYSQAVVYVRGGRMVEKMDIAGMAPYILAHRLDPTEDFRATYRGRPRESGGSENFELAHQLVQGVNANYERVKTQLALLDNYRRGTLDDSQLAQAESLLNTDIGNIDHPLVRHYITALRNEKRRG